MQQWCSSANSCIAMAAVMLSDEEDEDDDGAEGNEQSCRLELAIAVTLKMTVSRDDELLLDAVE